MKNPPKRKSASNAPPLKDLPLAGKNLTVNDLTAQDPTAQDLTDNSYIETFDTDPVPQKMVACVICGSETQTGSPESMCWVCRRLKISAWRDVEQQVPAQE